MTETARIRTLGKAVAAYQTQTRRSGLPYLREFIVSQHIALYAHSKTETEFVLQQSSINGNWFTPLKYIANGDHK